MSKSYTSIDYCKLFCALLVVGIHVEPFQGFYWLDNLFGVLTRIAVPFFFITSAYFYTKKQISWQRCILYCKRILLLYVPWTVFFAIIEIMRSTMTIRELAISFLVGNYNHLWYLHASIIAAILLTILYHALHHSKLLLAAVAAFLYLLGTAISTYYPLIEKLPLLSALAHSWFIHLFGTRNGLFFGFPYFVVGYLFAEKNKSGYVSSGMRLPALICLTIVCFALLSLEGIIAVRILNTKQTIFWISLIPLMWFLFDATLHLKLPHSKWGVFFRKCSTYIYCIHPAVLIIMEPIAKNRMILYLLVAAVSFGAAALYQSVMNAVQRKKIGA